MNVQSQIVLDNGKTVYLPGEQISGTVKWDLPSLPKSAELRLFWHTLGKGSKETCIVKSLPFEGVRQTDERTFSLALPDSPYSFSGKLITLSWGVELVFNPDNYSANVPIVMGPGGAEIDLYQGSTLDDQDAGPRQSI